MKKITTVLVSVLVVVGMTTGAAAGSKSSPPVRGKLVHPCDVAAGIKAEKRTEELCLKVWAQPHQVYRGGETPAGPTLVSDLRDQVEWSVQHEGTSRRTAEVEFARGLSYARQDYLTHKK